MAAIPWTSRKRRRVRTLADHDDAAMQTIAAPDAGFARDDEALIVHPLPPIWIQNLRSSVRHGRAPLLPFDDRVVIRFHRSTKKNDARLIGCYVLFKQSKLPEAQQDKIQRTFTTPAATGLFVPATLLDENLRNYMEGCLGLQPQSFFRARNLSLPAGPIFDGHLPMMCDRKSSMLLWSDWQYSDAKRRLQGVFCQLRCDARDDQESPDIGQGCYTIVFLAPETLARTSGWLHEWLVAQLV